MITIKESSVDYVLQVRWNVKYGHTSGHPEVMHSDPLSYYQVHQLQEDILSEWRVKEVMRVAYGDEVFDVDCARTAPTFEIVEV